MLVNLVKPVRMKKIIIKFQKVIVTMKSTIKKNKEENKTDACQESFHSWCSDF